MLWLVPLALATVPQDITAGPPPKDKPSVAGWGFWSDMPKSWQETHQRFFARTRRVAEAPIDVLFLGDSITSDWLGAGKVAWERRFVPMRAENYGIGGDTTRQLRWRLAHGEAEGLRPKAVVLMIGTNNLYADHNSGTDEEIVDGIEAVVGDVRRLMPKAKILLLAILPRNDFDIRSRVLAVNALVAKRVPKMKVEYLDLRERFEDAQGQVRPALYLPDRIHLSAGGYDVLGSAIAPIIDRWVRRKPR